RFPTFVVVPLWQANVPDSCPALLRPGQPFVGQAYEGDAFARRDLPKAIERSAPVGGGRRQPFGQAKHGIVVLGEIPLQDRLMVCDPIPENPNGREGTG